MSAAYRRLTDGETRLDWSHARVDDPKPCVHCGTAAILRHPVTGRPCHKVCDDARAVADHTHLERRLTGRAANNRTAQYAADTRRNRTIETEGH